MNPTYTGRKSIRRDGLDHFAEVTIHASPCDGATEVVLRPEVLDHLREVFGPDFEHHRHCVRSAVAVQIDTAPVAGYFPFVEDTSFRAEVIGVSVSGDAGRQVSGFLLSVASMDAIAAHLHDWETEAQAAHPAPPGTLAGPLAVDGYLPPLAGLRCDAILFEERLQGGRLVPAASRVYLNFEGRWSCFDFAHEILSWKSGGIYRHGPVSSLTPPTDSSSRVVDLATPRELVGLRLERYAIEPIGSGMRVAFDFEGGRRVAFRHRDGAIAFDT